jgi:hypothetical protein
MVCLHICIYYSLDSVCTDRTDIDIIDLIQDRHRNITDIPVRTKKKKRRISPCPKI